MFNLVHGDCLEKAGCPILPWVIFTLIILTKIVLIVGFIAALFYSLVQLVMILQQLLKTEARR